MLHNPFSSIPFHPNQNPSSSSMQTKRPHPHFVSGDDDAFNPTRKKPNSGAVDYEPAPAPPEIQQLPEPPALDGGDSSSSRGLHLLRLLLHCAECVATDDLDDAADLLPEISELSSPFGTPPERVAAYFAHALQARVISTCLLPPPPSAASLKTLSPPLSETQKIFSALQCYNSISPLIKFSHFTANQAIFEALNGEDRVHIIDLDIMQGLQWPGLFHILAASRSRNNPMLSLRITGFGSSLESLQATGKRLAEFADLLGLPFQFTPWEGKMGTMTELIELSGLGGGGGGGGGGEREATVVHWTQHSLYDIAAGDDLVILKLLTVVRPKLVTVVEQDLNVSRVGHGSEFLGRFVEALHYYSALFDALGEEGLGEESAERHTVEQQVFGREIRNVLRRPLMGEGMRAGRWREELRRVGFRSVSLGGSPATQAGLLLGMLPCNGYTLVEENGWLRLGWKDLPLLTASAWEPSH